jgi:RecB family endonuclease NucS
MKIKNITHGDIIKRKDAVNQDKTLSEVCSIGYKGREQNNLAEQHKTLP